MANPTTNYGFVLPTSSDLVTDLPADFDVALQGVDTRLKALQPGTTLGDLAYSSATANTNTRLAIGSTGNVLTVSGGVPVWAAPAGGGKVLQVVQGTSSTNTTTTNTSYTTAGLTASITPSSATSKVLVVLSTSGFVRRSSGAESLSYTLLRGSTEIAGAPSGMVRFDTTPIDCSVTINYLDSPATTSATSYTLAMRVGGGGATVGAQKDGALAAIVLLEIGA